MEYQFIATCLFGLEKFLGEEIEALGYKRTETMDGRITFEGGLDAIARCNIGLRCAERVLIKMGSFKAESFTELFDNTKKLPWGNWIGKDDAFPVKGHSIRSALTSIPDCQSIIKKAVVESLKEEYGIEWFKEDGIKYQIEFFIFNNTATLMIDTSGVPLHKRGYRPAVGDAPLRETLACAMVKISRPREEVVLWDPFCGSGTIAIEAALLMTNTAPGLFRSFVSEDFYDISPDIWKNAKEEAQDKIVKDTKFIAYATDIDPGMVAIANSNAKRAGVSDFIKIFRKDALTIGSGGLRGTIVCNPPYGERISTAKDSQKLYQDMGKAFSKLDRWQIYILTSEEKFEYFYGKRADNVRKLYNGMIKCGYYQYFKTNQNKLSVKNSEFQKNKNPRNED